MKNIAYFKQRLKKIYYYLSETVKINLPVKHYKLSDYSNIKKNGRVLDRVNYYCKDQDVFLVSEGAVQISDFKKKQKLYILC